MPIVYLNGRFLEQSEAALDPLDRGVLLGDGVFETIRCEEGQLFFHVAHFSRLQTNARLLGIPWSMPPEELLQLCQQVLDANGLRTARLRITLTSGESGSAPDAPAGPPTLLIHAGALDAEALRARLGRGLRAVTCDFPLNHRSPLARVKSTSYAENLLARKQAREAGVDEALLLNTEGRLAEAAMANLFLVRDNTVLTPPVEEGALPGIVRLKVGLLCHRVELDYQEAPLEPDDLLAADEAFLTNAIMEIAPLIEVDGKPIGPGRPGDATEKLYRVHRDDLELFLETMRTGGEV